ncbi:3-hydroxyacyl-[acyl-carrier-protein] dehydratase FabZ [Bacillus thuringiensis]|uniref:3-hydroxyacyl-ACP dehydratase FabZ n=1 Tax=Bacillus cereus group TaxID=86661 RepID=UPI000BF9A649|nr:MULTISPECIES: 3-hydroxyacyl-ACP dehydratase FabZ [Bacillus cereus group]MBE5096906.1 3-hydroxyacyl-ACP dehydratase FabZ [Bacillus thuringiensis]MEB9611847.1 3-hydroxyacyl-ACP dehydratase FabZ [Bacillus cereus]PFN81758.1 3-hydroxyacyl-[acyl-carrier-protein] dehydratase FabZ [Bacillus thuringiensis]PGX89340.1 3-hydroxyacyl-[acyl-carrier-protein] dehydratase FabZ [Bacillus thuringiensis]QDD86886.1 3-hydroxyacyl-acyl-carrier-protein dehydratase [Bacillus cereus]
MLDINQIQDILPHRYPFLLIDCITELEEGKRAVGIKNVTVNEPFFYGHFPENQVMPGVLILEALTQVSAIIMHKKGECGKKIGLFAGIDNCQFKKKVIPGDRIRLEVNITRVRASFAKAHAIATVNQAIVCEADITIAFSDPA